jgi:putative ABC transport system permease protein
MFLTNVVDFDFLKTIGIKVAAGHLFSDQFTSDSVNQVGVVLNETGVKTLGYTLENCIGKGFHNANDLNGPPQKIVGVMKDFHFEDLHQPIGNVAFSLNNDPYYKYILVHVSAGNLEKTIGSIRQTWRRLDPNEPFEYSFLDAEYQKHYDADNRLAALVGYATLIAIFISCLGLFGLAAFSAEQRTKEIGIRKVLGASSASIITLLSGDFMKLVLIAIVIGSPIGWYATRRWLQDFPYRTTVSWMVFALTAGVALFIAFATISLQAFKAATAKPVDSLKDQ